ncbi:hypothetical protein EVJ29_13330 [Exiguobacterium sp. SH4S7]|uniref:hypothetical protein n=1 Tax=Exiguobacterium sp. SH4S7 TaxID=2510958 RepID=UPI00103938B7|nr:hypothetical protein [Exiguobacterium sp. SH4S7]TCI33864.1 hypothetical protein EVJ29_13330 [Exiguobacterium sp. SH4S7]
MKLSSIKKRNAVTTFLVLLNISVITLVTIVINKFNVEDFKVFSPLLNVVITASITISIFYYTNQKEQLQKIKKVEKIEKENESNITSTRRLVDYFEKYGEELVYLKSLTSINVQELKKENLNAYLLLILSPNIATFTSIRIRQTLYLSYSKDHTDFFGHDETEKLSGYFLELKELLDLVSTLHKDENYLFQITVLSRINDLIEIIKSKQNLKLEQT